MRTNFDLNQCDINSCGQWATITILTYTLLMFCVSILMDFSWEMLGRVLPFGKMGHQIRQCSAMHVAQDGRRRVRWQTTLQYIARMTLMMMNLELAS